MSAKSHTLALSALLLFSLLPSLASAGNFGVTPIRLDLGRDARTGAVTVTNDSPDAPLNIQVRVFEWTQDAEGKDQYEESKDLTYFPRILTLPPQEKHLVRAGIRVPPKDRERAYRLFIEEIPDLRKAEGQGSQVAIAVRFGVPVFVKPLTEEVRGEIESLRVAAGKVEVSVRNSGNVHFAIDSVKLKSGERYEQSLPGWYLLPGAARTYAAQIPPDVCMTLGRLDIVVKTDRMELTRSVEIDKAQCR